MVKLGPKLSTNDDYYLLLLPDSGEEILAKDELVEFLTHVLLSNPELNLASTKNAETESIRILETSCELTLPSGERIQWFATRVSK